MDDLNKELICILHPHASMLYLMSSFMLKLSYVDHILQFKNITRITRPFILSMSLKLDTHIFHDIYLQQEVVYERARSWMFIFDKFLLPFFSILQTNSTIIHNFVKGQDK
jgi:hypothetical protein